MTKETFGGNLRWNWSMTIKVMIPERGQWDRKIRSLIDCDHIRFHSLTSIKDRGTGKKPIWDLQFIIYTTLKLGGNFLHCLGASSSVSTEVSLVSCPSMSSCFSSFSSCFFLLSATHAVRPFEDRILFSSLCSVAFREGFCILLHYLQKFSALLTN